MSSVHENLYKQERKEH
jgi:hypothetical protein